MTHLVIQLERESCTHCCALCGRRTPGPGRPQLALADTLDVVCHDCGKAHDPILTSLVDLACAAERVARIGRHTVTPPLTALLDLAHAAENYLHHQPLRRQPAA